MKFMYLFLVWVGSVGTMEGNYAGDPFPFFENTQRISWSFVGRKCPTDWTFYNCSCYKLIKSQPGSIVDQLCRKDNSSLAIVTDLCTLFFLQENYQPARIGINSINNGKVKWNDGSKYAPPEDSYTRGSFSNGCLNGDQDSFICPPDVKFALCQIRDVNKCEPMICSDGKENAGIVVNSVAPTTVSSMATSSTSTPTSSIATTSTSKAKSIHITTSTVTLKHQATKIMIKPGELLDRIAEIKSNLTLNKKDLSSNERKLESATDDRTSSKNMGVVAGCVICIFPVLCVLSDCSNMMRKYNRSGRIFSSSYK